VPRKAIPAEALIDLTRQLASLPPRSHERRLAVAETARGFGVSEPTLYRALAERCRPKGLRRADRGAPRVLPADQLERYCELIAAIKMRTSNRKGRHLSTAESIRLLENFGIETPEGLVQATLGSLNKTTVNRYLRQWGYDRTTLGRPPPAVRFQAEQSNDCWQFDLSPSDLKHVEAPSWVRADQRAPTLMLFSVVDDRSGVAYQEYRCVYGEDVVAALRFLFNTMSEKASPDLPLQGIAPVSACSRSRASTASTASRPRASAHCRSARPRAAPCCRSWKRGLICSPRSRTGPTGAGKTWLACAFGQQVCRQGFSVFYVRVARLFEELKIAHGDGSFTRRLAQLAKIDVLIVCGRLTTPYRRRGNRRSLSVRVDTCTPTP
jgi:hypothetical protein